METVDLERYFLTYIYQELQKSNPQAKEFIEYLKSPEDIESLSKNTSKDVLDALISSRDNIYVIEEANIFSATLRKHYNMNLDEANLVSTGHMHILAAHFLPKNSPWTPIVSLGFCMLEEQGFMQRQFNARKDEFNFPSEADGIPLNKVYLLFMFIATFYALSFLVLIFEWIWSKCKE